MFENISQLSDQQFYQFIIDLYPKEEIHKKIDNNLFSEFSDCGTCQNNLSERYTYPKIKVLESGAPKIDLKKPGLK